MKTKCLLMLLVVFSCAVSFAGGPAPNNFILQIQNAGSPVVTTSSFIRLNCSTNVTCSLSGGTVNITASSTASTAWTAITAGTNAGQALLIGAGGSLGVTAGGTITASAAPWSGLTGFPSACTNQAVTGVGASLTCTTVTSAYVDSSIGKTGNPLSQFASTTSAQLLATLSNPTGTGLAVFATSPSLTTPNIGAATASGLTLSGITGSTQCLQVNSSGVVAGSGAGCGGAGGSPGGSPGQIQWNSASAFGGVSGWTTNGTTTLTAGATSVLDLSAMAPTAGLKLPSVAGAAPTADGFIGVNVTNHTLVSGSNGTTLVQAAAATGTNTATTCSNQVVTAVSGIAAPTCTALTGSFLPNPSASTLGGVESLVSTSHQWINTISTSGVPSSTQPTLADIAAGVAPTGTFDFSGTTILKARVGATLTTSVNGDIGYDTTNKNWHVWQNAADSYLFSGLVSGTYTNGDCVKFNVASSVITLVDNGSACAGSAIINAANQYALSYYSAAGSASTVSGAAAPTVNGSYLCGYVISGSAASAPTCNFPGVAVDATNPATLLYTDRASYIQWTVGSTLTLPPAATNFATNFPFVVQNTSGGALALTPTTPNNIDGGSSQATSSVPNNYAAFVYQDATPNWQTIKFPTLAAFGTCADSGGNHLNVSSIGVFSCGTSSSGGAFSSLTGGTNSAAAMVIGTGSSLTVSGSGTNNATSVNGNTFPASTGFTSGGIAFFSSTSALGSSALLAANSPIIGGGAGTAPKTVAGLLFDGTSKLTTGQSGTSAGNYCMANLTSGTICLAPTTGALGSAVWTFLTGTDTVVGLTSTQTLTNKTLTTAQLGSSLATTQTAKTNNTTLATTAYVDAPTGLTTGTSVTLSGPRQYFVCTTTCTITVPVPAAGDEFCVMNDDNVATVITMSAIGSSARYENTARTAYGTATTGTFISGGAVGDKVCLLGRDATHYFTVSFVGTWTAN